MGLIVGVSVMVLDSFVLVGVWRVLLFVVWGWWLKGLMVLLVVMVIELVFWVVFCM